MLSRKIFILICFVAVINLISSAGDNDHERSLSRQKRKLLFPQFTTLQLSMAMVLPVTHITSHRFAVNVGFQINYGLPFNLAGFYNPVFFARSSNNDSTSFFDSFFNKLIESKEDEDEDTTIAAIEETTIIEEGLEEEEDNDKRPKRDVSAGEFYNGIRETLSIAGYNENEECLLRSVCELAKHPLTVDKENIVNEIVHFILTPSAHTSFDEKEELEEKKMFEAAEALGKSNGDCELKYQKCDTSPLHAISHFEIMSE